MLHSLVSLCDFGGVLCWVTFSWQIEFTRKVDSLFAYPLEKSSGATILPLDLYYLEVLVSLVPYVDYLINY